MGRIGCGGENGAIIRPWPGVVRCGHVAMSIIRRPPAGDIIPRVILRSASVTGRPTPHLCEMTMHSLQWLIYQLQQQLKFPGRLNSIPLPLAKLP